MIQQEFDKLKERGFNPDIMAQKLGAIHLLNCMIETQFNEYEEYLKEYGLANNFRNELNNVRNFQKHAVRKINSVIPQEGLRNLLKDSEQGEKLIDIYAKAYISEFLQCKNRFRAKKGCYYYYRDNYEIKRKEEENTEFDDKNYNSLNYFENPEDAL